MRRTQLTHGATSGNLPYPGDCLVRNHRIVASSSRCTSLRVRFSPSAAKRIATVTSRPHDSAVIFGHYRFVKTRRGKSGGELMPSRPRSREKSPPGRAGTDAEQRRLGRLRGGRGPLSTPLLRTAHYQLPGRTRTTRHDKLTRQGATPQSRYLAKDSENTSSFASETWRSMKKQHRAHLSVTTFSEPSPTIHHV